MTYSNKVNQCKPFINAIKALEDDGTIQFIYRDKRYKLKAYTSMDDNITYSVWDGYRGMNVNKVGKTSLTLYSYDMMSQRTNYRLNLLECSIVEKTDKPDLT